jgi:putative membrane protein insertion efficiency factor
VNGAQHILIFAVRLYQRIISPAKVGIFGPQGECRFTPSCSQYAVDALRAHGAMKGTALAAWRVCRCHPWGGCGEDPVPPGKFKVQSLRLKVTPDTDEDEGKGSRAILGRSS